jgi:GT2 family glycosyltransferase
MISIIIVNYNGKEHTRACLQSLRALSRMNEYEIILVDNCSTDGSVEALHREFPEVTIIAQTTNGGFGQANNRGARSAKGEYLFFLNNDTVFIHNIIETLHEFLERHRSVGAVAPMLLNSDGSFQLSFGKYPSLYQEFLTKNSFSVPKSMSNDLLPKRVDWVSFAAVMIRTSAFEDIHGFDERYFMYFEDADCCYRLGQKGYTTFYHPGCSLIHISGASWQRGVLTAVDVEYRRSQILYYSIHHSRLESLSLRLYIFMKYLILYLFKRGQEQTIVSHILSLSVFSHAYRS